MMLKYAMILFFTVVRWSRTHQIFTVTVVWTKFTNFVMEVRTTVAPVSNQVVQSHWGDLLLLGSMMDL